MNQPKRGAFVNFFVFAWEALNFSRRLVLNGLFLLVIGLILFAVLKGHSILGRFAAEAAAPAEGAAAFREGVLAARAAGRASGLYFSARARVLAGDLAPGAALDYLSGLLIGEEIAAALAPGDRPVLIGDPALSARYRTALALSGAEVAAEVPEAAVAGLWKLAQAARLVA